MELVGGGTVTQAAREEMARVLIAGIPFIPPNNVQFIDIRRAFIQGDRNRGGNNVANLEKAFDMHGLSEGGFQNKEDPPRPDFSSKGVVGFQEVFNGVPVVGSLSEGAFADFFVRIPNGATELKVQTFVPGSVEQGDVVLYVAPSNFTDPSQIVSSDSGYIVESITVTDQSTPPLSTDSAWLIEVADYTGDFTSSEVGLLVTVTGGDAEQAVRLRFGQPQNDRIEDPSDIDLYYFAGTAGQGIEIAVDRTGTKTLDPLVLLGTSTGTLLAYDDDGGGDLNALLRGFTIPATDFYLVQVQSAVTAQGPFTSGDYRIELRTGSAVPPTPTPGPTPNPNEVTELSLGVTTTGTIGPSDGQTLGISRHYKVVVPQGANELVIRASERPTPRGNVILQVRKGRPVGDTLDDYIGLGGRRSTVVVTRESRVPLDAGEFFVVVYNTAQETVEYEILAEVDSSGGPTPTGFDRDGNGIIDARDLLELIGSGPTAGSAFLEFGRQWKSTAQAP